MQQRIVGQLQPPPRMKRQLAVPLLAQGFFHRFERHGHGQQGADVSFPQQQGHSRSSSQRCIRNRNTRGEAGSSTMSSAPGVTAIWGAATPSRQPPRLSSIWCWPSSVHTRIRGGAALNVNTCCPPTANPVIALGVAASLSAAIHELIQAPSGEYFSMRPVFGYATKAEPSCVAATASGRSSVEGASCRTFHEFNNRPRPLDC